MTKASECYAVFNVLRGMLQKSEYHAMLTRRAATRPVMRSAMRGSLTSPNLGILRLRVPKWVKGCRMISLDKTATLLPLDPQLQTSAWRSDQLFDSVPIPVVSRSSK